MSILDNYHHLFPEESVSVVRWDKLTYETATVIFPIEKVKKLHRVFQDVPHDQTLEQLGFRKTAGVKWHSLRYFIDSLLLQSEGDFNQSCVLIHHDLMSNNNYDEAPLTLWRKVIMDILDLLDSGELYDESLLDLLD
ncbi:hypothetical protein [Evansella tamaricis]|uniref:Uncharacterized protein n=1 Tax=Evansella tamaricis TaxID=2069301 RepID=A0ABS6JK47_9BACI|nr:hypothetical protein [Evansella tamaricis]MBU9712688.1 hypothetical protein [Evansella tamaricis]